MGKDREKEIRDAAQHDKQRGTSGRARGLQRERKLRADLRRALAAPTEKAFADALREDFGISETSANFARLLEIWREQRS